MSTADEREEAERFRRERLGEWVQGPREPIVWDAAERVRASGRSNVAAVIHATLDAVEAAGVRLDTPATVQSVAELAALPVGAVVRSAAGTIACRQSNGFGVLFGVDGRFEWPALKLPATVLYPHPPVQADEDLVERVAKAIFDARELELDQEDDDWDSLPDEWAEEWRELARAALAAMGGVS